MIQYQNLIMKSNKVNNKEFSICIYDEIDKLINVKRVFRKNI